VLWRQVVSQSPSQFSLPRKDYLKGWALVLKLIREHGLSLSGREANCCFLNTGQTRFANISTVSGLDFIDDARGCAVVDWDKDGDLDVWVSNRTAPQARYLRNDVPVKGNFIALRLLGTKSNRDAIGARVSLTLAGDSKAHIKTLRAGEGFLSQSSKWMHFGVGDHDRIQQVCIKWPDGTADEFSDVPSNQFYQVVEGAADVQLVKFGSKNLRSLTPTVLHSSPPEVTRTVVAPREKAFALSLVTVAGETIDLRKNMTGPTLVNLWSETCAPCLKELTEFSRAKEQLAQAGLRLIAVRSPNPREDKAASVQQLKLFGEKLQLPFEMAAATDATMTQLTKAQDNVTQIDRPLVLPTSFLLDADGRLSVIYRGPVSPERLLEDVRRLELPQAQWNAHSVPFPGHWFDSPFSDD
jgi:peroxiredoxin